MKAQNVPSEIINDIGRVLQTECDAKLNKEEAKEFLVYLKYVNHTRITQNMIKVKKDMTKIILPFHFQNY